MGGFGRGCVMFVARLGGSLGECFVEELGLGWAYWSGQVGFACDVGIGWVGSVGVRMWVWVWVCGCEGRCVARVACRCLLIRFKFTPELA